MVVWGEQPVGRRQPQQIVPFLLICSPSLPCSPPIPSPYFTFSNVSITAGHKPPCCVCVCVGARGREKETKEDHIKDFPCLLRPNVLPLAVSFSPLMWPVLISSADIAAVPSPLVEKDSFPTEKDALEHSTHAQYTRIHTHSSTFEQWGEAARTENGFFWGGEWKDQVAVKSTKPRATLRAARCQQLLSSLSLCSTQTQHTHTTQQGLTHTAFCDMNKQRYGL